MIEVQQLAISQGTFSLRDVGFTVKTGAYAILMGLSGSGKTTILEAVCGLRPIDDGIIRLASKEEDQNAFQRDEGQGVVVTGNGPPAGSVNPGRADIGPGHHGSQAIS